MKAKRIFISVLTFVTACILSICALTACGNPKYSFVVPDGVTVAIFADMWGTNFEFEDEIDRLDYSVVTEANIAAQFTEGIEFVVAPINVGASIHKAAKQNKTPYDYKLMNVTSWGVLYYVTTESGYATYEESASANDFLSQFDGKTVQTIGITAIPGKATEYLFDEVGADVTLEGSDASTIQTQIARGDKITAVFAEPAITALKNTGKEFTVLGSVSDVYTEIAGSEFPMAGLFVRSDVCENNQKLVNAVNDRVSKSVEAFRNNIDTVAQKVESIPNCSVKAAALKNAKDRINVKYKNSADSKNAVQTLLNNIGAPVDDDLFI